MVEHLMVMRGALERGEAGSSTAETRAMADEGARHVGQVQRFLHGEITRDQLDRGTIKKWNKQASRLADELVKNSTGPAWEPNDNLANHLVHAGERATGVITGVRRNGWGNDRVADLAMSVSARTSNGTEIELERTLSISVVKAPRVGDSVEVAYDPDDPTRFVYRPLVEMPGAGASAPSADSSTDRIGRLRELAELLEQGLLTRDEFDAEKARLLAE
jgi:hypothetical protein